MKVGDIMKRVKDDGWYLDRTEGDHRQFRHLAKPGQVTIAGHPSDEVHPKTLKSILRQAGIEEKQ